MKNYEIHLSLERAKSLGLIDPEDQWKRVQLWLLGMSEALPIVSDKRLNVTLAIRSKVNFSCDSEELVELIRKRIEPLGAFLAEPY